MTTETIKRSSIRPNKRHDLVGKQFGRWTVLEAAEDKRFPSGYLQRRWLCRCDCGTERIVLRSNLTHGRAKLRSCGCLRREHGAKLGKRFAKINVIHGHSPRGKPATPIYKTWINMRQRCYDANNKAFRYYGGRGISVCDRWSKFENFLSDMGPKPEGLTIDRIDTEGHYTPSNCRWATRQQQSANRNYNRIYTNAL